MTNAKVRWWRSQWRTSLYWSGYKGNSHTIIRMSGKGTSKKGKKSLKSCVSIRISSRILKLGQRVKTPHLMTYHSSDRRITQLLSNKYSRLLDNFLRFLKEKICLMLFIKLREGPSMGIIQTKLIMGRGIRLQRLVQFWDRLGFWMKTELYYISEESKFLRVIILLKYRQTTRKLLIIIILNRHLYIAAYDVESPESLLIEIPEKKAQEILT